ncbi:MAG: bifunctional DNA-formamidopyrimidine glycosylase/DNA-(apurinic or apyrimidinic site) lyase [Alphaproteobacteria bacterium]|nr:bifunctional DNA-formamidopyrimidine glycosylase/DNA-(apurinic or apyrimidinic site) lyase [Alphaproteobacteria bacterium]
MPELPEVETVRQGLASVWEWQLITGVLVRRPDLRRPLPSDFSARRVGRTIESLQRRAKYLLVRMDGRLVLLIHLGMSGRMVVRTPASGASVPEPHDHVVIETGSGAVVTYRDPRRFGLMLLLTEDAVASHSLLRNLGPEPLDDAFTSRVLAARLAPRRCAIKAALLDQRLVAGLGNIYVCEALFRAGIAPDRLADSIKGKAASRLTEAIKAVLTEAIQAGGTSLRDHRRPSGEIGLFQHRLAVYGRAGAPCPGCDCGEGIKRIVQGGRSTFFCARKQG